MAILITGGAGYIGSHMVYGALEIGEDVVVVDNLSTGLRGLVAEKAHFYYGSAGNQSLIRGLISQHHIKTVLHFAGSVIIPESAEQPLAYYDNNVVTSRNLLEVCVESGVKQFIFSSTAAVYAPAVRNPVRE